MKGYCSNTNDTSANCCINAVSASGTTISFESMTGVNDVQYTMSDDRRTMTMTLGINADSSDIQNGRLTLRNNYYTAYKVIQTLAEFENNDASTAPAIRNICDLNSISLTDTNMAYNGSNWELQQIKYKSYALPFVMNMEINYDKKDNS